VRGQVVLVKPAFKQKRTGPARVNTPARRRPVKRVKPIRVSPNRHDSITACFEKSMAGCLGYADSESLMVPFHTGWFRREHATPVLTRPAFVTAGLTRSRQVCVKYVLPDPSYFPLKTGIVGRNTPIATRVSSDDRGFQKIVSELPQEKDRISRLQQH
jgi:hypothetical protein